MFAYAGLAALIAGSILVHAEPVPSSPGPGDVFKVGEQCLIVWDADTSGVWKNMDIQLMSGNNFEMVHITTVATVDGTDPSKATFSYPCPEVTPNSAIYFYQFSTSAAPSNLTWTTRFTIAAADGTTKPPANEKEPDGQAIPWGTGALVDPSQAKPAPSYLAGGAPVASTTGTTAVISPPATTGTAQPSISTTNTVSTPSKAPTAPSAQTSSANSSTAATNRTQSGASAGNGALSALGMDNIVRAGVALGVAAFTFAIAL